MSNSVYQSVHTGAEIDEAISKIPNLEQQINSFAPHMTKDITQGDNPHGIIQESGIWTPMLIGSNNAGNHTYTTQEGRYVIQNNIAHIWFNIELSAFDNTADGQLRISGVPVPPKNPLREGGVVRYIRYFNLSGTTTYGYLLEFASAALRLKGMSTNGEVLNSINMSNLNPLNNFLISGSITYEI